MIHSLIRSWQSAATPGMLQVGESTFEWFKRVWNDYINYRYTFGNFKVSLTTLVFGIAIFLGALLISRWLRAFLARRMESRAHLDPGLQYTLLRLLHYVIVSVGLISAFSTAFNTDLTSIAVVFTALSVGIGFGLQYIAGDIASGFILLFERPVRIGDFITVTGTGTEKNAEGRVQSINLRTTTITTNDRISVIIPNSKLVNQNLINWSYADRRARIAIPIGVAYDSDVDLVTATLLDAAEGINHVLIDPKPGVQFLGFGESSLDFRLLVWTDRPRRHPQIKSDINYRIHRLFKEAGIEVPFPQRDLNLRGGALQLATPSDGDDSADEDVAEHDHEPTAANANKI